MPPPPIKTNVHKELCSTLPLQILPHTIGVVHHSDIVGLGVCTASDTRTAMRATTTVQGRELRVGMGKDYSHVFKSIGVYYQAYDTAQVGV